MRVTHDDLEGFDLDWFAIDSDGHVAHFATGGRGAVPRTIDVDDSKSLSKYFRGEKEHCNATADRKCLVRFRISSEDSEAIAFFLEDYALMASRGLYSYGTPAAWGTPPYYYCVARPEIPVRLSELPGAIQEKLQRGYVFGSAFAQSEVIRPIDLGDVVS